MTDNTDDEKELSNLLETHKQMNLAAKQMLQREIEQRTDNAKNNLNIFTTWISENLGAENLYPKFVVQFDLAYRMELFENICEYFMDSAIVSEEAVFYWKYLIYSILSSSKKYKPALSTLVVDPTDKKINLVLTREKYIFRCFLNGDHLCYFKENGNDYYVS